MLLSPYSTIGDRIRVSVIIAWCAAVIIFIVAPILVPIPLSFNKGAFFTFPLSGFSLKWYHVVLGPGDWRAGLEHSVIIACAAMVAATALGTMAAIGLAHPHFPARRVVTALLISPLVVPIVIVAVGLFLFYAPLGLANTFPGIILAHTILASPFVLVTVGASLSGFDYTTMRAAAICGAKPLLAFRRVMLPAILSGVLAGAALAFVTSFDEVVVAMFMTSAAQRTLPVVMFTGLREELSLAITAASTVMMVISIALLGGAEGLRRRAVRRVAAVTVL